MLEEKIKLPYMDAQRVTDEIGDFVIDTVLGQGRSGAVIGLSGGIDSSTTAALIKRAFDIYNKDNPENPLELVGYMLPSKINSEKDTEDGERMAKHLGIRYEILNLEAEVEAHKNTCPEVFQENYAEDNVKGKQKAQYDKGNMISRIRGNVINTKAAIENKLVAGTGNKDEDFGIGYYTLFGDGAVHFSSIGNLSKRLVRQMGAHLGLPRDLVEREPSAGLEPGQTDFGDLGYGYDAVEIVTEGIMQGFTKEQLYTHPQVTGLVEKQIASLENPRLGNVKEVVDDIMRRHRSAKGKMELIN